MRGSGTVAPAEGGGGAVRGAGVFRRAHDGAIGWAGLSGVLFFHARGRHDAVRRGAHGGVGRGAGGAEGHAGLHAGDSRADADAALGGGGAGVGGTASGVTANNSANNEKKFSQNKTYNL